MKRILILIIGLFGVAQAQFAPTSAKTAFKNGVSIGTKDSTAYNAADSLVVVINRQGRMMYRSTDGYWKILSNAAASDYVPYTGAVDNVNLGNFRLTARSLRMDSVYANGSGGVGFYTNSGTKSFSYGAGGSTEVTFHGFAGYDANRSASYTTRSFTDKGYVDSADALRVKYTDTAAMLAGYKTYYPRTAISLTTTGSSGAATYNNATGVLNIPQYAPDLSGYVPYTGATANVNLGAFDLTADVITGATGSFSSSGSSNTLDITHSSGSGIALNITKSGNGEGLYINKTSGSGNAATIIGTLNATTLVKSGGTSSQFLKADGSVDGNTYALVSDLNGYVPTSRTLTINGTSFDLSANRSWSVGTVTAVTASAPLSSSGGTTPNITISQASTSTNGFLSSTDWNTFNGKQAQLNGTGFVRFSGTTPSYITGTSSQFVKADGSLDNNTYATTGSLSGYLPLTGGTLTGSLAGTGAAFSDVNAVTLSNADSRIRGGTTAGRLLLANSGTTSYAIIYGSAHATTPNTFSVFNDNTESFRLSNTGAATFYNSLNGTSLSMSGGITANGDLVTENGNGLTFVQLRNTSTGGNIYTLSSAGASNPHSVSAGSFYIRNSTNNTTPFLISSSGNVGIGVTPSAWFSDYRALQISNYSSFYGRVSNNESGIFNNAYRDAAAQYTYINTAAAGWYAISSGVHQWFNAPSGTAGNPITFTQAMTLTANSELLVNTTTTDGTNKLIVNGGVKGTTGTFSGDGRFGTTTALTGIAGGIVTNSATSSGMTMRSGDVNKGFVYTTGTVTALEGASGVDVRLISAGGSLNLASTGAATFSSSVTATGFIVSSSKTLKDVYYRNKQLDGIDFVGYTWKKNLNLDKKKHLGFIAEEVEKVMPDAVSANDKGVKAVNYTEVLIYKLEKLTERVEELESEVKRLKRKRN